MPRKKTKRLGRAPQRRQGLDKIPTMTMNTAEFGSISSGTMRTEDLLEAFADHLAWLISGSTDPAYDDYRKLIAEAQDCDLETSDELLGDLFDALNQFAPPYAYFGAHEGDGADYGFWLCSDAIDHAFDGLRVEDTSEVPDDYSGEVLHITDHGNLTLYIADKGKLTEVWALV